MSDRNESEFEPDDPPEVNTKLNQNFNIHLENFQELFLDMSIQENLLENARVGITTLHQCDFDFEVEDTEKITEDNVIVTGFTVE